MCIDGISTDEADQWPNCERTGVRGLDVPLAELGAEPFQEPRDRALGRGPLQPQQALMFRQQIVPAPDAAHAARADLQPAQGQLVGDPYRAMGRVRERMVEDGLLDLRCHPVRVRISGPWTRRLGPRRRRSGSCAGSRRTPAGCSRRACRLC